MAAEPIVGGADNSASNGATNGASNATSQAPPTLNSLGPRTNPNSNGNAAAQFVGGDANPNIAPAAPPVPTTLNTLTPPPSGGSSLASTAGGALSGAAAGAAIGSIVPGVGTVIGAVAGGAIAGLFCHAAGTMIRMADGTRKAVEDLRLGDKVLLGGEVIGRGEVRSQDLWMYGGTVVNGQHAVFQDGRWTRVENSLRAVKVPATAGQIVYPIVTEHHLLACEKYICADYAETDDGDMSASARLERLNSMRGRNAWLDEAEARMRLGQAVFTTA